MKKKDDIMIVGNWNPRASRTQGYNTLSLGVYGVHVFGENNGSGVMGYESLLYQTPDKQWHLFMGTQSLPECRRYSAPDIKKAYAGERCYDENGIESTVQ